MELITQHIHIFHVHFSLSLCQRAFHRKMAALSALPRGRKQVVPSLLLDPALAGELYSAAVGNLPLIYLTYLLLFYLTNLD